MKNLLKLTCILGVLISCNIAIAFEPDQDCLKFLTKINTGPTPQNAFNNYTDTTKFSKQLSDGTYTLCFDETNTYSNLSTGLNVAATSAAPIIIYGLNLSTSNTDDNALLTISGPNVTLQNSILSGPADGDGTAIKVLGQKIIIENNVISNFNKGIYLAANSAATITNNTIKTYSSFITDAVIFESSIITGTFVEEMIAKHISDTDQNIADKLYGLLWGKETESCAGSVEVLIRKKEIDENSRTLEHLSTCSVRWIENDADKITAKRQDESVVEIGPNACIFECTNLSATTNDQVAFLYTDSNGSTNDYLATTPLVADLPNVITFAIPSEIIPSGYTAGEDGDTISAGNVIVTGDLPEGTSPSSKAGSPGGSGDGMVSQGAKMGCSLVKNNEPANFNIVTLLAMASLLAPLAARRAFALKKCK